MLRKCKQTIVVLISLLAFAIVGYAGDKRIKRIERVPAIGPDYQTAPHQMTRKLSVSKANALTGPGLLLFESTYDLGTNNAVPRNIHNYGDGTYAIARMLAAGAAGTWPDRGTFHVYNDGTAWLLPMVKVEAGRTGWGNISAMSDGRCVISAHAGVEVNIDALKGLGIWTSTLTGEFPAQPAGSDLTWPRTVVDGADNIHMVVTHFTLDPFPELGAGTQYPVYARSTDQGLTWQFSFPFQKPGAAPTDPPDTTGGLWLGGGDADSYAIDAYFNKVGIVAWTSYDANINSTDILFAESFDNGQTWTWQNISGVGTVVPPPEGDFRPNGHLDFVYDREGIPHVVWGTFWGLPDSAGTSPETFSYTLSPIMHWSPGTGVTEVISRSDIPGGAETGFPGSENWGRGLGSGLYWPSIGVGIDNKLYMTFNAPTPGDVDADSLNYLDVYATGSADGGRTWGAPPANVTNTTGTEDKYASLAKLVDDSLRIVYFSDEVNGGIVQPGNQTGISSYLYLGFAAAEVPTTRAVSVDEHNGDSTPQNYVLGQNYPNPFNPSTQISFTLPVSERVTLKIFNTVGQAVSTLVEAKLPAGQHSYVWNAPRNLPSGVYFYQLNTSSGITLNKKLVLMK